LEIHSSALIVIHQTNILNHRLWRGQSEFLLPIIEKIGLNICQNLLNHYGNGWPLRWDRPESDEEFFEIQEDPLAISWGYLMHLLLTVKKLSPHRHFSHLVSSCRSMRNHIAHHRIVSLKEYEYIQREVNQILIDNKFNFIKSNHNSYVL